MIRRDVVEASTSATQNQGELVLQAGEQVCGRWNRGLYRIIRLLGSGANGSVYLVHAVGQSRQVAMKIAYDNWQLQAEVNVLQQLEQEQAISVAGCTVLDNDCFQRGEKMIFFYIMNHVSGEALDVHIRQHGHEWLPAVGAYLLERLEQLHAQGWAFVDLKPSHVRVDTYGRVELIDYGGVVRIGTAIKQYTPLYDRGCWKAGNRTADRRYDLFAFGIMLLQMLDTSPQAVHTPLDGLEGLQHRLDRLDTEPLTRSLRPFIRKLLYGELPDCTAARMEWSRCCQHYGGGNMASGGKRTVSGGMIGLFACSAAFFAYALLERIN